MAPSDRRRETPSVNHFHMPAREQKAGSCSNAPTFTIWFSSCLVQPWRRLRSTLTRPCDGTDHYRRCAARPDGHHSVWRQRASASRCNMSTPGVTLQIAPSQQRGLRVEPCLLRRFGRYRAQPRLSNHQCAKPKRRPPSSVTAAALSSAASARKT